jgi:hypothetical protein
MIDSVAAAMLEQPDRGTHLVIAIHSANQSSRLRHWRVLVAVLVAVMYLLSGVLHCAHDIDVTSPSGGPEVASILDDGFAGQNDHKALGGHHCHGCFSVAVAQPLHSAAAAEPAAAPIMAHQPALAGSPPNTDPPPPKHQA